MVSLAAEILYHNKADTYTLMDVVIEKPEKRSYIGQILGACS